MIRYMSEKDNSGGHAGGLQGKEMKLWDLLKARHRQLQ